MKYSRGFVSAVIITVLTLTMAQWYCSSGEIRRIGPGRSSFVAPASASHTNAPTPLPTTAEAPEEWECPPAKHPDRPPELIHITKTGGSTLTVIAATHNVTWSACYWLRKIGGMKENQRCPSSTIRPSNNRKIVDPRWGAAKWHLPLKYLHDDDKGWINNVTGHSFFIVTRDPYERLVSSWNYQKRFKPEVRDAVKMNKSLIARMKRAYAGSPSQQPGGRPKRWYLAMSEIPQFEFLSPDVRVLRLETLERDFLCMMRNHGYDWKWPKRPINKSTDRGSLTTANLTAETREWIELFYRQDFEQFGYPFYSEKS